MARQTQEAIEKTVDDLESKIAEFIPQITISTQPVVITGVQRKAYIGNYETIDVYCAVSLPQNVSGELTQEKIIEMVKEAAEIGFYATSKEVSDRYKLIKDSRKSGNEEQSVG